ncbi:MAG: hypothetical protein ABW321_02970 [Polyangiales bacterium]
MRWFAALTLCAMCFGALAQSATAHAAAADTTVIVLGLRSIEGDDEFANAMTDALRTSAKSVEGWRLLDRAVSMSQLTFAYNCDDVDAGCLSEISRGLNADRVIFGTVRRTAAKAKYDYEVTLSLFNGSTHTIVGTETQTVDRAEGKKSYGRHAQSMTKRLASADANAGQLLVEVNVLSSEVKLDGQLIGQTHDGRLTLETVGPGEHTLEVSALGHQIHTQPITINPAALTQVNVMLERTPEPNAMTTAPSEAVATDLTVPASSGGSLQWLGYTLIGVGAASAIAWGASMYMIEFEYNRDATYQYYKNAYQNRTLDACEAALGGDNADKLKATELSDFQSRCRAGRTFQVLQWVFLGAAVVAAGAGVYVLISDGSSSSDRASRPAKRPRLTLDPLIERRSIALQATLRF